MLILCFFSTVHIAGNALVCESKRSKSFTDQSALVNCLPKERRGSERSKHFHYISENIPNSKSFYLHQYSAENRINNGTFQIAINNITVEPNLIKAIINRLIQRQYNVFQYSLATLKCYTVNIFPAREIVNRNKTLLFMLTKVTMLNNI